MIIESIVNLLTILIKAVFGFINLPSAPDGARAAISNYFNMVFNNLNFLGFFVRISTLKIIATVAFLLFTFKRIYHITMWIYLKLPTSSE